MRAAAFVFVLLAMAACKEAAPARVQGTSLIQAKARELWTSPTGNAVATLADAAPSGTPGAPADVVLGRLMLATVSGGPARELGGGVSNLPGSVLFSKDGRYVALIADYSVPHAAGELRLAKVEGGAAESVAKGVSFVAFSPKADAIAYVAEGALSIRSLPDGATTSVTTGVSMVEFGPAGSAAEGRLLVRRSVRVDGALLTFDLESGKLMALAGGVTTSGWAPDGSALAFQGARLLDPRVVDPSSKFAKGHADERPGLYLANGPGAPVRVTEEEASEFKFSPTGKRLAYVTAPVGGNAGDLYVVDGREAPKKVASRVAQFVFAPDGSLALLGAYDRSASAGTLGLYKPDGSLMEVARSVKQFTVSPKGLNLIYLHGVVRSTIYSLGLAVHRIDAGPDVKPRELDLGVSGYTLDEAEQKLAFKAHCIDEGRTCSLLVADLGSDAAPKILAARVGAFEFVPGGLLVVTSRPLGKLTGKLQFALGKVGLDVPEGARTAPITMIDDTVAGEFARVGEARDRVAYLVDEPGREGVSIAPIP